MPIDTYVKNYFITIIYNKFTKTEFDVLVAIEFADILFIM